MYPEANANRTMLSTPWTICWGVLRRSVTTMQIGEQAYTQAMLKWAATQHDAEQPPRWHCAMCGHGSRIYFAIHNPPIDEVQRTHVFMLPGKPLDMGVDAVMEHNVRDVDWPNLSRDEVIEHAADLYTNLTRGAGSCCGSSSSAARPRRSPRSALAALPREVVRVHRAERFSQNAIGAADRRPERNRRSAKRFNSSMRTTWSSSPPCSAGRRLRTGGRARAQDAG
jgi:hypothetical protein